MEAAAREHYEQRFTFEQMYGQTAAIYRLATRQAVNPDRGLVETV